MDYLLYVTLFGSALVLIALIMNIAELEKQSIVVGTIGLALMTWMFSIPAALIFGSGLLLKKVLKKEL